MASKSTMVFFVFVLFSILFSFENRLLTSLIISSYLVFFFLKAVSLVVVKLLMLKNQWPWTKYSISCVFCECATSSRFLLPVIVMLQTGLHDRPVRRYCDSDPTGLWGGCIHTHTHTSQFHLPVKTFVKDPTIMVCSINVSLSTLL